MMKYNILIVDDDYQNLQILNTYLEEINPSFDVIKTNRSEKAIKLAGSKLPDLMITDWEMPVINGLDVIKTLKSDKLTKNIPIIMLTGFMTASANLKEAFEAGAADFISKPVTKNELAARVNSILHKADHDNKTRQLNTAKDRLISMVAHNLAGPYKDILDIINKLNKDIETLPNEKIKQYTQYLNENLKMNYKLLNNFIQWTGLQLGNVDFKPVKISVQKLSSEIFEVFRTTSTNKNIDFKIELEKDYNVLADKYMLTCILDILINNAFKYTKEKGSVVLNVVEKGSDIQFRVSDTGIGISDHALENLFKFEVIRSTPGTKDEKGIGLGLILCKEFIEINKGKIWVESKIKRGSDFYFTIPCA